MQVKLPTMGTGVPDAFSGSAMQVKKPAGRLREMGNNIKSIESQVKKTVEHFNDKAAQFAKRGSKLSVKA